MARAKIVKKPSRKAAKTRTKMAPRQRQSAPVRKQFKKARKVLIKKFRENPVLRPVPGHPWESKAAFNPAAIYEKGRVHLVYRAIGDDDTSSLGYASSADGLRFDERLDQPIYLPPIHLKRQGTPDYIYSPFASGGGLWGGCEDPRITKIDGRFYMTFVAYDGSSPPRAALTSITEENFHAKKWNWTVPVLISPPGVVDKNAVVFSEKINGKYVIMHRIFPNILIDFVDSLDLDGKTFLRGEYKIEPRTGTWDSRKIGAGAPPIKTQDGWLLIYHAVDDKDSSRYKIGAMLLDLEDPRKVLYRSPAPILEPTEWYENNGWKSGVVYPCGAVVVNDELLIYYGGADMVTCVAYARLDQLLRGLKQSTSEIAKVFKHAN